jgi:hypothetical protein
MERFIGWGGWSEADGLKWELNTIQAAIPIHFRSRPYAQNHTLRAAMAQSQHDQQSTAFTSTAERRRTTSTAQQPSTTNQPSVPLTETREALQLVTYFDSTGFTHHRCQDNAGTAGAVGRWSRPSMMRCLRNGKPLLGTPLIPRAGRSRSSRAP